MKKKRLKERGVTYVTRSKRSQSRATSALFPQTRHLTRKERVALEAYKNYLLEKLPDPIERIILFGSKARGESSADSDIDLFILVSGEMISASLTDMRWSAIVEGAYEIDLQHGVHISPIVRHVERVKGWTPLLDHIHKDGVELWRRSESNFKSWLEGGDLAVAMSKLEHIEARRAMAREKMSVARDMLEKGHFDDTGSRAYYAMFYASKSLLLALGEDPHKHEGVVSLFGERIAKVRLGDPKYGTLLRKAEELREDADYEDFFHATREQAEGAITDAEDFVNATEQILKKIQARGE